MPSEWEEKPTRFYNSYTMGAPDECWEWRGLRTRDGYGKFSIQRKYHGAHRVAWELATGLSIPEGMSICHKCDNRSCVNPDHLFLGTPQDNTNDMVRKGRQARGQRAGGAKLSKDDVAAIFRLRDEGLLHREIAESFPVTRSQVSRILRGVTWIAPTGGGVGGWEGGS